MGKKYTIALALALTCAVYAIAGEPQPSIRCLGIEQAPQSQIDLNKDAKLEQNPGYN